MRQNSLARATSGTILDIESLQALMHKLQTQSIFHRLRTGELRLASTSRRQQRRKHYEINRVKPVNPLFHSPQLGFKLVYARELRRVATSREYVLHHPNRPRLDQVFARMARLSDSLHFSVTVIIVPTFSRV